MVLLLCLVRLRVRNTAVVTALASCLLIRITDLDYSTMFVVFVPFGTFLMEVSK